MLFQDSGSNLHLNLTLLGAAGTITGQVGEQAVLVRLPPHRPANSSHTLRLGARSPCAGGEVRVSLRPLSSLSEAGNITKTLPCVTMNMRYRPHIYWIKYFIKHTTFQNLSVSGHKTRLRSL